MLIIGLLAAAGSAAIYLAALPALWRISWPYGLLFTLLGLAELGTAAAVLLRPTRRRMQLAMLPALAVLLLWTLSRPFRLLPAPDPWVPVDSVIGITDFIVAGLQLVAVIGLAVAIAREARGPSERKPHSFFRRILTGVAFAPLIVLVLLGIVIGLIAGSDGFAGAGFPAGTVAPRNLPAGRMSTVEYCRPAGVPLAMDLYMPPTAARAGRPAPVALYVHGGVLLGDRKMYGAGGSLANHQGALFTPLQQQLNQRGFVVAAIDYRLPPATPWPAQIEDAKCAVRFLRAHAADLGIDPARIGVWGSSGGGNLSSLIGLSGPTAGFDRGQYPEQSSAVQAVVDMFGVPDLINMGESSPFARFVVGLWLGKSTQMRRAASPLTYVSAGAPPFLILHGMQDSPHQSEVLAQALHKAGVPATLIEVQGTGHTLDTPGEQPSADELTAKTGDFFTTTLQ